MRGGASELGGAEREGEGAAREGGKSGHVSPGRGSQVLGMGGGILYLNLLSLPVSSAACLGPCFGISGARKRLETRQSILNAVFTPNEAHVGSTEHS